MAPQTELNQYRPVMMWFWNAELHEAELRRQIGEFQRQGILEFFVHPAYGLEDEYLSKEYFHKIKIAVDEARTRNMKFWIYDECNWPSGTAGGRILEEHPEMRQFYLTRNHEGEFTKTELKGVMAAARWTVHSRMQQGALSTIDRAAFTEFLQQTHERYRQYCGDDFGKTVIGVFSDETAMSYMDMNSNGGIPWGHEFSALFQKFKGYQLEGHLESLLIGTANVKLKYDYWDAMTRAFAQNYAGQISEWCDQNQLKLTGHMPGEERLSYLYYGDFFSPMQHFHFPGCDDIFSKFHIDQPEKIIPAKLASSTAHFAGRSRVLCETYTGSGWDLDFTDMKRVFDRLAVTGINMLQFMGAYYSIKGFRKTSSDAGYAPSHSCQNPLWPYYGKFSDYVAGICRLNCLGHHAPEIAVLYPSTSIWCESFQASTPVIRDFMAATLTSTCKSLMELQLDFDFMFDEVLATSEISDGRIICGKESFSTLILPTASSITARVWSKAKEFAAQGGRLIFLNGSPYQSPDLNNLDTELEKIFGLPVTEIPGGRNFVRKTDPVNKEEIREFGHTVLVSTAPERIFDVLKNIRSRHLPSSILAKEDRDIWLFTRAGEQDFTRQYFLVNRSERQISNALRLSGSQFYQLLNPENNTIATMKTVNGEAAFSLAPFETVFIRELSGSDYIEETIPPAVNLAVDQHTLPDLWDFQPASDNMLKLNLEAHRLNDGTEFKPTTDGRFFDQATDLIMGEGNGLGVMRGQNAVTCFAPGATYVVRSRFKANIRPEKLRLITEDLGGFDFTLNNHPLPPFTSEFVWDESNIFADIKDWVVIGINTLEFKVKIPEWTGPHTLPMVTLSGNFAVFNGVISPPVSVIRTGPWNEQGFPHYSGTAIYRQEIYLEPNDVPRQIYLQLQHCSCVAEVVCNEKPAGIRLWPPYKFDLTGLLKPGTNELVLEITNTGNNFFGNVMPPDYAPIADKQLQFQITPSGLLGKATLIYQH